MTAPHLPFELTRTREVRDLRDRAARAEGRLAAVVRYLNSVDESTPWSTVRADVSGLAYGMREPAREEAS